MKNLSGSKTVSAIPEILRNAQDDPQHNTLSLKTYPNTPRVVKSIRNKHVILNAVKNLSGCKTVSAIPEILRNAQK